MTSTTDALKGVQSRSEHLDPTTQLAPLPVDTLSNEEMLAFRQKYFLPTAALYYKSPIQLVRAKGNYVYDETGRAYFDAIGGIICNSAGHNHPRIQKKLAEMMLSDEIQHSTMLYHNQHVVHLGKKILSEASNGIDRVAFTNSGSEANELAFMAARHATGESMVINLRHSYHGGTSATLAACGHHTWRFRSQPVANVTSVIEPNCYRCPFSKDPDTCHMECAKQVEATIQTSTHGKIAAFIAEPVMGVGGFITPPKEYFQTVAKIVKNYGGKYISDEVQTGAGRTGESFLFTKSMGIEADIITMAKGFGNGAAIGAALMTSEVAEPLSGKLYFNTFAGDPFQTAQAKITMDIIDEEKLVENARLMGNRLKEGLTELMKKHTLIGDVRGRGLLLGVELVKNRTTKEYATAETNDLMERCKDKGLLIGKGGLFGNVLRVAPALSVTAEQIDFILHTLDECLTETAKSFA